MKQRVVTGTLGGALLLLILMMGGIWFAALIALLALFAYYEFVKMTNIRTFFWPSVIGGMYVGLLLLGPLSLSFLDASFVSIPLEWMIVSFLLLFFAIIVLTKNRFTVEQAGVLCVGILYIGLGFSFLIETRMNEGFLFVILILLLVWSTDTAAYFAGKYYGKRKLWPEISPKKTIAGAVGGVGFAILVGLLFQWITSIFDQGFQMLLLAFLVSIFGQMGDLVISAFKRYYHVKDSGAILPGHGGVLDRFDSLLYVFLMLYLFQLLS